jgi:hypothetical protein
VTNPGLPCLCVAVWALLFPPSAAAQPAISRAKADPGRIAADSPLASFKGYIYAATPDHRHLVRRNTHEGVWEQFATGAVLIRVAGLSADEGFLYVADAEAAAVYKISIETGAAEMVYRGAPLEHPSDLAVLGNHVYVSSTLNSIADVDIASKTVTSVDVGVDLPRSGHLHLAAFAHELIFSIPEASLLIGISNISTPRLRTRSVYLCPSGTPICESVMSNKSPTRLPPSVVPQPAGLAAIQHPGPIALRDGILYIVDEGSHKLYTSSRHLLRPVHLYSSDNPVKEPSSIAVTKDAVVVLDSSTADIVIWPLLVPAQITVDVKTSESLSSIYNYLYDRGILPTKVTPLRGSMERILREEGALLSPYVVSLNPVICGLNPGLCAKGMVKTTSLLGTPVVIPDLYSENFIDVRQITLDGKHSLRYEVARGIQSGTLQPWRSAAKLLQLNPQFNQSRLSSLVRLIEYERQGTFTVPVELVRYFAAVPALDLEVPASELGVIQARSKAGLTITSLVEFASTPQADLDQTQTYYAPLDRQSFEKAYKILLNTINYRHPPPLISHPNSSVGVAEDIVDCDDQDIRDACKVFGLKPQPQSIAKTSNANERVYRESRELDHGTSVAALIGARQTGFAGTGLAAPEVFLVPIHSTEPPLTEEMRQAVLQGGTQVFNLSFAFKPFEYPRTLFTAIADKDRGLSNALFVVSAPDDGNPVEPVSRVPIMFANRPNVIGVAGTLLDGSNLIPNDGGSMWGTEYVQVAAPGIGFGATGLNNSYVSVGGTSFAAPLVSATAALLIEQGVGIPRLIKQRIIATSTVVPAYKDKVKGGLLNVGRAVSNVAAAVLVKNFDPDRDPKENETVVLLEKPGSIYIDSSKGTFQLPLKNLLRLTLGKDGSYRVIFQDQLDDNRLVVLEDVSFSADKPWNFRYRLATAPGAVQGPIVSDCLCNYTDYFGPILK